MINKILFATMLLFTSISAFSQLKELNDKVTYTVHLRNGDVITGDTKTRTMIVSTEYGALAFPVKNISKIELGIRNPNTDKNTIENLLARLNAPKPEEQRVAFELLCNQEVGAIPVIEDYIKSDKNIGALNEEYSAENVIRVLRGAHNIEASAAINDIVTYDEKCVVEGTCNLSNEIILETSFGSLTIPRNSVLYLDVVYQSSSDAGNDVKQFIVNANKNISGNSNVGFLNTGISLKVGTQFTITATGKVTLASLSNNVYTPDGGINGAPAPNDGGTNTPTYGCLVFKIGESGTVYKAGSSYKSRATDNGTLYLAVYETVFNNANSGAFKVKIKLD